MSLNIHVMTLTRWTALLGIVASPALLLNCVGDTATVTNPSVDSGNQPDTAATTDAPVGDASTTGVNGKVVDLAGLPLKGLSVRLGTAAPTQVADDGSFSFPNAPPVYDLDIAVPNDQTYSYRGLHTRTPTLRVSGGPNSAQLDFNLNTTLASGDAGLERVHFYFLSQASSFSTQSSSSSGTAALGWDGVSPVSGSLIRVIYATSGGNQVLGVRGQPTPTPITLTASTTVTANLPYADVPTSQITGTIATTVGTPLASSAILHDPLFPPGGLPYYPGGSVAGAAVKIPTFNYGGATYDVSVTWGVDGNTSAIAVERGLSANGSGFTLDFKDPVIHVTAPAYGATGVTSSTPFSWSSISGVFEVVVGCGSYVVSVVTTATSMTLPDLSAFGVPLPPNTKCGWRVTSYPTGLMEDFATDVASLAKVRSANRSVVTSIGFTTQ
jgi:hypothetical protein